MKIAFISWAPHCSRSDNIARELGGTSHMVYLGWLGSNLLTVWLKYLGHFFRTLRILRAEAAEAVFVMTPPVFAVMSVYAYCRWRRVPYIIDAHTAAFLHPRWKQLQWLQSFFGRRAATTIVTNEHLAVQIRAGGGDATIVRDVPVLFPSTGERQENEEFTVVAVCSFNSDEPVEEIFSAARLLPEIPFLVTGNPRNLSASLSARRPANLTLTGFLPVADYGQLIVNAGAVLTLTTRDHTMLRGAYEAVYQGTPVIVSDWQMLRQAFDEGAIHVDNGAAQIAAAVRLMQSDIDSYRAGARSLQQRKLEEWRKRKQEILSLLIGP